MAKPSNPEPSGEIDARLRAVEKDIAEMRAAVSRIGDLEKRAGAVDNIAAEAKGAVSSLKWMLTVFVLPLLILAIGGAVTTLFWLGSTSSRVSTLVENHDKEIARLERTNDAMARRVEWLERRGSMSALVVEGTIVKVEGNKLVIHDKDGKERRFEVEANALVQLDGKEAKLADLRPKMYVELMFQGGEGSRVAWVDAFAKKRKEYKERPAPPP
ncbi:MAG: hypothetical protein L0Z62_45725 [Gemmataceae bacterium]|nr:hypothetical protein [Gemmataceae bacterium]